MKDWKGNSESTFVNIGASSHSQTTREANDYYATDPSAIDDLFRVETFDENVWECAGGGGHLANRMREFGKSVWNTDIIDRGCQDDIVDFLTCHKTYFGDIITYPPYKYCTEFILKALELVAENHKVAMFLKIQTLESQERYEKIFSKYPPRTIYVYTKRKMCGMNGDFKGSSAVCYAWFVWHKGFKGDPVIKWLKGGE